MIQPTPLQEILPSPVSGIRLFIKRDDLLHPEIQGNKWRKLAPVIHRMGKAKKGILSFGGPFSNHLHALASAGKTYGFPTIGIIRGTAADLSNPTLAHVRQCGMKTFPISKTAYEELKKADITTIFNYIAYESTEPFHLLPEGGDSIEALVGCKAIAVEIRDQLPKDAGNPVYFCVPAGTGCTAAGVMAGANGTTLVFPAAPYGVDRESILDKLSAAGFDRDFNFEVVENILPKKFAKMTDELLVFVKTFRQNTGILLDPIYTSKMMFKLYDLMSQQYFPVGSCVVALHTGGLQGWQSRPDLFPKT